MLNQKKNPTLINSIVGEGSEFKGEFLLAGDIRIDGILEGKINTDGKVLIGENGKVIGDIIANEVIVGGEFQGNLVAHYKLTMLSTGKVNGNIAAASLNIDKGTQFDGLCKVNSKMAKEKIIDVDNLWINLDNDFKTDIEISKNFGLKKENEKIII